MRMSLMSAALAVVSCLGSVANAAILSFNPTTTTSGWSVGYSATFTPNPPTNPVTLTYAARTAQLITSGIPFEWVSSVPGTWINAAPVNPMAPTGQSTGAQGWYKYSQSFNVAAAGPVNGSFSFNTASDNHLVVHFNGSATPLRETGSNSFSALGPVSFSGVLNAGLNVLDFYVFNDEPADGVSPTGLHVSGFKGEFNPNVIPEPASIALWGGALGLGLVFRRRRKVAAAS
jgi:hypothetical protein